MIENHIFNEKCSHYERYVCTPSLTAQRLYHYPQWAGYYICKPDFYIQRQNFTSILMLQTINGTGKLCYKNKEYLLAPGTLTLIDCTELHSYFPMSSEPWSFRYLHFYGNHSQALCDHIFDLTDAPLIPMSPKIESYLMRIIEIVKNKTSSFEVQVSHLISNILYEILLNFQHEKQDYITFICDYIAENYKQPLSTESLAKMSGFSRCYFSTLFKQRVGMTLHEYLLCRRLDNAKLLLLQHDSTISEIAEMTGFKDVGTFIRAFKKKEDMTPLQYKLLHQPSREVL